MASNLAVHERIHACAVDSLGFDGLRSGQAEAVAALLEGRDTVVVMATGSGKSAVYQIAASLLGGLTVVVSPLLSLQRDQVTSIRELGIGRAEALNSSIGVKREAALRHAVGAGEVDFLFAAPEQLVKPDVRELLAASDVRLVVIDEAHCISEWGHDFRPDYLELAAVVQDLDRPPVLAMTATASPRVREEMASRLAMGDPEVVIRGFDRPNVRLEVDPYHDPMQKRRALVEAVMTHPGPGIVYAAERRTCTEIDAELREGGLRSDTYHGALGRSDRRRVHEAFMAGELDVVVATVAFGMGIDKADVRFVFHADTPPSLDEYYQEVGRAGRDGAPALARLYWRADDLGRQGFATGSRPLTRADLGAVLLALLAADATLTTNEVAAAADVTRSRAQLALLRLHDVGVVGYRRGWIARAGQDHDGAIDAAEQAEDDRARWMRSRVEMMGGFADSSGCRRAHLLGYFGEPTDDRCENCDRCDRPVEAPVDAAGDGEANDDEGPFAAQQRVDHDAFGAGTVMRVEDTAVTVLFDRVGYKMLDSELVQDRDLLRPAAGD